MNCVAEVFPSLAATRMRWSKPPLRPKHVCCSLVRMDERSGMSVVEENGESLSVA